jgi:PAS domain S-box-containing protein
MQNYNDLSKEELIDRINNLERKNSDLLADNKKFKKQVSLLMKEKYFLESLMENIPDTIYFKDSESRFIRINSAQAKMLGLDSPLSAIGLTDFDFFTSEHASTAYEDEQRIIQTGEAMLDKTEYIRRGDKQYRWVSCTKVPLRDSAGNISGVMGMSRDITLRKNQEDELKKNEELLEARASELARLNDQLAKSENELREINKTKDNFFSIISHDLRGPFSGFLGISKFLVTDTDTLSKTEIKTLADTLNKALFNQYQLLEDLLEWSRIQTGKMEFNPENLNIFKETFSVIGTISLSASAKRINIINEVSPAAVVYADKNMFRLVIRNIINNSVKFTHENGTIILNSNEAEDSTELTISDTGVGIPDERIRTLFSIGIPHSSTDGTMHEKGTGLGLALCKDIITLHNGTIAVKSEIGKGTTFTFTFPRRQQEE